MLLLLPDCGQRAQDLYREIGAMVNQLAGEGYDVLIADWRGKGFSRPLVNRRSKWGLHELICEDIPALFGKLDNLRPGAPLFCFGVGVSNVLLVSSLARFDNKMQQPRALVQMNPVRRRASGFRLGPLRQALSRESAGVSKELLGWRGGAWTDPVDGFNYRVAARCARIPASLYLYSGARQRLAMDLWMEDLGKHNARLIQISKRLLAAQKASTASAALKSVAADFNFYQIHGWFDEFMQN